VVAPTSSNAAIAVPRGVVCPPSPLLTRPGHLDPQRDVEEFSCVTSTPFAFARRPRLIADSILRGERNMGWGCGGPLAQHRM